MEAAVVNVATGALKPVLGKLATLLGDENKCSKGVRGEIESLSRELAAMEVCLLKMSEEEDPDVQDKVWRNEVRELSYDMEDSINDFIQSVDGEDTKPGGFFLEKMKKSLEKFRKMKAHHRIGNDIGDSKKEIVEVAERNERYKTREAFSKTKNATIDPRALGIFAHASKLVGVDEPKAEIIKLLTEAVSTQEQVKLVSIVGSGGMGKTTLANQVYEDLKGEFKYRAFFSVSRSPDMMNIMRIILSEVSGKSYAGNKARSLQQLIRKITKFLADKRYFVVVDDIWDMDTWNIIKLAFPMTSSDSIIITTTRINDVAKSCRATSLNGHIYGIRPLDMVHSRQLFHTRLFNSEEKCPLYLEEISEQILEKCAGLPLAIIAIASLLDNTQRIVHQWEKVKDSIGRALQRNHNVEGMMKILSLSYFDLPAQLKSCLLYFSIFPEDSIIERKVLIKRWIAESLIHAEGGYTPYELGERCFNELINRSLIQPGEMDKYGRVKSCRLHDTILEFIISKSTEENFVTLVDVPSLTVGTQSKVRRLFLQGSKEKKLIVPSSLVLSHVRSLDVFGSSVEIPCMDKFRHLRFLNFRGCYQLENHHLENVGRLFQLRYLSLQDAGYISQLPEKIMHLKFLEVLDIRGTDVCELPASIVNIKSLVQLLMDDIDVKLPCGISKMQGLEKLKHVSVHSQTFNFLEELGRLKCLKNLVISCDNTSADNYHESNTAIVVASVRKLENLLSLGVTRVSELLEESLCPVPLGLQKLVTKFSMVPRVPKWVGSLVNLKHLGLQLKEVDEEDLCILGGLPALCILSLEISSKRRDTLVITGEVGFPSLMVFHYLPWSGVNVINLKFAAGAMPKLDSLNMRFRLDEIKYFGTGGTFDFGIKNLPSLHKIKCVLSYTGDGECIHLLDLAKSAMLKEANQHPNHPTVSFNDGCYAYV